MISKGSYNTGGMIVENFALPSQKQKDILKYKNRVQLF